MKHQTLLHRDKCLQASSLTKRTIQSDAASTETEKKKDETVVISHCNASTECKQHTSPANFSQLNNVFVVNNLRFAS